MAEMSELKAALESILFVADRPIEVTELRRVLDLPREAIEDLIGILTEDYKERGFRIARFKDTVRMVTASETASYVQTFLGLEQSVRLSGAALEALAIIAFRQPVTRAQVEAIRGVNSDGVIDTLEGRGLIEEVGRRLDKPGHPLEYATTMSFLQHFGLQSLDELAPAQLQLDLPTSSDSATGDHTEPSDAGESPSESAEADEAPGASAGAREALSESAEAGEAPGDDAGTSDVSDEPVAGGEAPSESADAIDTDLTAARALADQLRAVSSQFRSSIQSAADSALRYRPAPGEWSAIEVIGHLVDKLQIWHERAERIEKESAPFLPVFDQDAYVLQRGYQEQNMDTLLERLASECELFAAAIERLPAETLARQGRHQESGIITLQQCIELPLTSVPEHLAQLENAIALGARNNPPI